MIAIASKPIRKRRQTRARRCTFKNAYTRFFTRVQYGPSLYAGYYAMGLGIDPMGETTNPGVASLRAMVRQLERWLDAGHRESAARAALNLYQFLERGGQILEPIAADNMAHWLAGTGRPKSYSDSDTWGAITDTNHQPGRTSPKEQLDTQLCETLQGRNSGTGWLGPFGLRATKGKYYHGFGGFAVRFSGTYSKNVDGSWDLNGMWQLRDRYDWHNGLDGSVLGVIIKDEYALLVEEFHGAKPYNQVGLAKRKYRVDCCSTNSNDSGGH